ncbi:MAG TPA: hypothetical protein VEA38_16570 [Terriglobales bacterium]|nr:hypothetical protein [Terriglobales bacterium]
MSAPDRLEAVVAQYPGDTRPARVHAALRGLRLIDAEAQLLVCELAWEAHGGRYHLRVTRDDGSRYRRRMEYLCEVLGLDLSRASVYKRLRLGRTLRELPEHERNWVRSALAPLWKVRALALAEPLRQATTKAAREALIRRAEAMKAETVEQAVRARRDELATRTRCTACGRLLRATKDRNRVAVNDRTREALVGAQA